MHTFRHEVIVNQPIDVVWKNISCLKGCINWSTLLRDTEKIGDEPAQVGSRYRHVGGFMGMTTEAVQEIKIFNPPYEFASGDHESSHSLVPVESHYTLSEVEGGTRVVNTFTFKPADNFVGRIAANVMMPRLQKQIEQDLIVFKELVESGVTVHA